MATTPNIISGRKCTGRKWKGFIARSRICSGRKMSASSNTPICSAFLMPTRRRPTRLLRRKEPRVFPERARDGGIRAGSETQSAPSNSSRSRGGGYYLFLGIVSGLLLFFLSFIHVRGAYHFPAAFGFFRRIFYLQYALF